jgi:hypothetical protein
MLYNPLLDREGSLRPRVSDVWKLLKHSRIMGMYSEIYMLKKSTDCGCLRIKRVR